VLETFGVERIDAEQETFDPTIHEAVAQVETDEAAEGTILHVDSPGYRLHDRCIRPAKVVVARRPSEQSQGGRPT
jgi:molecular chaperone GrpE